MNHTIPATGRRDCPAMRKRALALILLPLCLACGSAAAKTRVDERTTIAGAVVFPAGQTVDTGIALACPEPYDACNDTVRTSVIVREDGNPQRGLFAFENLDPSKRYKVIVWKDVDRNHVQNDGDVLGLAHRGEGVRPGVSGPIQPDDIRVAILGKPGSAVGGSATAGNGAQGSASKGGGSVGPLAGRWTAAAANGGSELKMQPTIKVMPNISAGGGFSLGGTGGANSPTTTVIVNEFKPVSGGDRRQSLEIRADGTFKWIVDRGAPRGSSCVEQVHEEREGRASVSGSQVTLAITGGFTTLTNPCGESFRNRRDPFPQRSETYNFNVSGGVLRLTANGGVNWTFRKN
ncbi:MAG: hypothetical protein QM761_13440 [Pseudoxanthomonas sp.]